MVLGLFAVDGHILGSPVDVIPPQRQDFRWAPQACKPGQAEYHPPLVIWAAVYRFVDGGLVDVMIPAVVALHSAGQFLEWVALYQPQPHCAVEKLASYLAVFADGVFPHRVCRQPAGFLVQQVDAEILGMSLGDFMQFGISAKLGHQVAFGDVEFSDGRRFQVGAACDVLFDERSQLGNFPMLHQSEEEKGSGLFFQPTKEEEKGSGLFFQPTKDCGMSNFLR